jgi:homoserine O-succinyltransferase
MPIRVADGLPAKKILHDERILALEDEVAHNQQIRPLKVAILNLMPTKITTENQIIRLLSNSPLQIELTLLRVASHVSANVSPKHMETFYRTFEEVRGEKFDGLIITGAPVENLEFHDVDYWDELCDIMRWSKTNVYSTLHICWAAQAALNFHYGIPKYPLPAKMFGVFEHRNLEPNHPLLRGFDETFKAPHSRHTEVRREDIDACPKLEILAESDEAGVYIIASRKRRLFYVTGHSEYDNTTLAAEYFRDVNRGLDIEIPKHYFPGDDPKNIPPNVWRGHAHLLFSNWLNYFVYQGTPYDIDKIESID